MLLQDPAPSLAEITKNDTNIDVHVQASGFTPDMQSQFEEVSVLVDPGFTGAVSAVPHTTTTTTTNNTCCLA